MITLMNHQLEVLATTRTKNRVAYYLDMGLGKTYVGSEKAVELGKNILVVCQKSKVNDWYHHFVDNYGHVADVHNLTEWKLEDYKQLNKIHSIKDEYLSVFIINYDLVWRRKELTKLSDYTLILDESSLIQNETAKRSKFIINKLNPANAILLSGTPVNGKYEHIWSQCKLLGWDISKSLFHRQYVVYRMSRDGYPEIVGYKNVDRLKSKLREYGAVFMKTEEVIDLPEQTFTPITIEETKDYKRFMKHSIVEVEGKQLVGDTTLTKLLYSRMLCSTYNNDKLDAFKDLVDSTNDRLIVFYNFNDELEKLKSVIDRPISIVNGSVKDLKAYEEQSNSITLVQYQAGAYGLNLQKANKIIYFSPTLSSEQFEQSKKRIHRIGQNKPCFYYKLITGIEHHIYRVLDMRKDYTDELFKEVMKNDKRRTNR